MSSLPTPIREGIKHRRLTEPEKKELIDGIAQGTGLTHIIDDFEEKHGFRIRPEYLVVLRKTKKWQPELEKLRNHYRARLDLLDNSHKYVRVKRMDDIYHRAVAKEDWGTAIQATEQARKEFDKEGESSNIYINNPIYNQLNVLSNDELQRRYLEATKRLKQTEELNGPSG